MASKDTLETITVKSTSRTKTFQKLQDSAYTKLKKVTGYEGDFSTNNRNKYFSSFEQVPIIENNDIVGITINYQLKGQKSTSTPKKSAGGSGAKITYQF